MIRPKNVLLSVLTAACLLGCVPPALIRTNARLQEQSSLIRTITVLPTQIKVYQIDTGGVREEIADWSAQARTNILTALASELTNKLNAAIKLPRDDSLMEEEALLEETRALYSAVSRMIVIHTFPNPNFPSHLFADKQTNFDYSLGREVAALASGANALLLLDAEDHVWTAGRQALQALGIILGLGAGAATGVVIIPQLGGGTSIRAALVDSNTGDLLWFNALGAGAGKDLRDATSAKEMVSQLFKDFPASHEHQSNERDSP